MTATEVYDLLRLGMKGSAFGNLFGMTLDSVLDTIKDSELPPELAHIDWDNMEHVAQFMKGMANDAARATM